MKRHLYLVLGIALVGAFLWLDAFHGHLYVGMSAATAVTLFVGARRLPAGQRTPWYLFAFGQVCWAAGDSLWELLEELGPVPFPSIADGAYMLGAAALIAGLVALVLPYERRTGSEAVVDVAMLAAGATLVSWPWLFDPVVHSGEPLFSNLVAAAYPLTDILLLTALVRLCFVAGPRVRSLGLLIAAVVVLLVADGVYAVPSVAAAYEAGGLLDAGWLLSYVLFGAAALAPVRAESAVPTTPLPATSFRRFALFPIGLALLLLAFPAHVIWVGHVEPLTLAGFGITLALVPARMTVLVLELRRLRAAHTRALTLFSAVFDAPGRAVTLATPDGRLLEANNVMVELLGYSVEELQRIHYSDYTVDAAELAEDNRLLAEVLAGERDHYTLEKRFRRKNSEVFWGSLQISKIHSDDGETVLVATISDVDERKHLEDQLRQAQKMEAVGGLAGGIAHDFNNLLTVIVGYAEVAKTAHDKAELDESIDAIQLAADRASSLTGQLLAFSRKQVVQPRRLDLNDSLANVVSLLERVLRADIELDVRPAATPVVVEADPAQIEQVLLNLVLNSQDAISGRGRIAVTTRRVALGPEDAVHAGVPQGEYIKLEVSDTGCGMDEETAARAFEPFFTTKGPGVGTGLGLATTYSIVEGVGGTTKIDSIPGLGTTVTVTLPALDGLSASMDAPDSIPDRAPAAAKVLLVEDEEVVRSLTAAALSRAGYTVLEAASGEEALALVDGRNKDLDVLLTDVVMPGMRGPALAGRLLEAHPELRVVFMSGYSDVEVDLAETGALWLQKPFQTSELREAVAEAASGRAALAS